MQPLDVSFFHPFKLTWKKCVPKWKNEHDVGQIKKEDFPQVLKFTLENMKNEESVVVSGFKATGLYPFDSNAVDYNILQKSKKSKQPTEELDNNNSDKIEKKTTIFAKFRKKFTRRYAL